MNSARIKNVLLVDDEPFFCELFQKYLLRSVFDVPMNFISVDNAKEAFLAASVQPIDLLITDYRMPGMTGVELIKAIEELPREFHPKDILLISGNDVSIQSHLNVKCMGKPLDFQLLQSFLQIALRDVVNAELMA